MLQQEFNLLDKFIRYLRLRKILPYLKKESIICDLGCGNGSIIKLLSSKIKEGYGIDKNNPEFEEKNLHFIQGDIAKPLPLENEKFNIVLFLATLEHLESPDSVFNETWRILKTKGLLILTTPTPQSRPLLEFLAFKLKIISLEEVKDHKHYYSKQELIGLLKKYKFKILKLESFCIGFNTLVVACK
jgi:SAM-dependent methyltransferase